MATPRPSVLKKQREQKKRERAAMKAERREIRKNEPKTDDILVVEHEQQQDV